MFRKLIIAWVGFLILGALSLAGRTTTPEVAKAPAPIAAAAPTGTTANEERGCAIVSDVAGNPRPDRTQCQGLVATAKKIDDVSNCVMAYLILRSRTEPVSMRPAGTILKTFKGCMMMRGSSEEVIDGYLQRTMCVTHEPQMVSECRASGYRN